MSEKLREYTGIASSFVVRAGERRGRIEQKTAWRKLPMFGLPDRQKDNTEPADSGRRLMTLPIDCIRPNPYQPRRAFDEESLQELAASIREAGLIQPLVVQKTARSFELIAGERRLRACRLLGMREVPCVVQSPIRNDENGALLALVENVQRRDLHYLEEAECYRAVLRTFGLTQETLAQKLGKSQAFLANKLRVLHLSPAVRRQLLACGLSERHARALLKLSDEKLQLEVVARVHEKGLTVKETERLIERVIAAVSAPPKPRLLRLLRDYRLFVNSVKYGAEQLRDTGLSVELIQTDFEDGVDMLVKVRRQERQPRVSGSLLSPEKADG